MSTGPKAVYDVVIDQTLIDAPDFPRDVAWWRGFLPVWVSDRRHWEKEAAHPGWVCDRGNITVDAGTQQVRVRAQDQRHGQVITAYLLGNAVGKRCPQSGIRLIRTPVAPGPGRVCQTHGYYQNVNGCPDCNEGTRATTQ